MSGEKNIHALIKNLKPQVHPGQFVFVFVSEIENIPISEILALFREEEGFTLILKRKTADKLDLEYSFIASWITLNVHSSLEAVGLTARVSVALAKAGISCNALAAYYQDHIFVPYNDRDRAVVALRNLK
jgi:uncharacterized protein